MFSVLLTGPPGAGKTVALTALSDAMVADRVEHAAVDVDEIAWAYPFPSLEQRCDQALQAAAGAGPWSLDGRRRGGSTEVRDTAA